MMMKITHSALAQPPMSWLRKMSTNTMISSQIQMTKRKKYSIVRKKSRIGYWYVAKSIATPCVVEIELPRPAAGRHCACLQSHHGRFESKVRLGRPSFGSDRPFRRLLSHRAEEARRPDF